MPIPDEDPFKDNPGDMPRQNRVIPCFELFAFFLEYLAPLLKPARL